MPPTAIPRKIAAITLVLVGSACSEGLQTRQLQLSQTVVIDDLPADAETLEIWLPVAQVAPHQDVALLVNGSDGSFDNDAGFGNRYWHAVLPARDVELTVRYDLQLHMVDAAQPSSSEPLQDFEEHGLWAFLQPTRAVPVGVDLTALGDAAKGAPHERARAALDVAEQLDGSACQRHERFASLARSAGVPVRLDAGWLTGEGDPQPHCWAQYYLHERGWVLADAQLGQHGARGGDRLRVSTGRDLRLKGDPDHAHHGQNIPDHRPPTVETFLLPYVELDGAPWDRGVQNTVSVEH